VALKKIWITLDVVRLVFRRKNSGIGKYSEQTESSLLNLLEILFYTTTINNRVFTGSLVFHFQKLYAEIMQGQSSVIWNIIASSTWRDVSLRLRGEQLNQAAERLHLNDQIKRLPWHRYTKGQKPRPRRRVPFPRMREWKKNFSAHPLHIIPSAS